jgi:hypothetical protein
VLEKFKLLITCALVRVLIAEPCIKSAVASDEWQVASDENRSRVLLFAQPARTAVGLVWVRRVRVLASEAIAPELG